MTAATEMWAKKCAELEAINGEMANTIGADALRLRYALTRLANEVRATMSLAEQAVRQAAGNTNYQCLMDAESEARVALGVIHQQQPPVPK